VLHGRNFGGTGGTVVRFSYV